AGAADRGRAIDGPACAHRARPCRRCAGALEQALQPRAQGQSGRRHRDHSDPDSGAAAGSARRRMPRGHRRGAHRRRRRAPSALSLPAYVAGAAHRLDGTALDAALRAHRRGFVVVCMISLRFTSGPQQGRVAQITGSLATLGRSPSCDVVLDDAMASGVHATLEMVPAGYIVSDQQSTNGTMLNGQRIWRALMRVGDELVIGGTGLKVEASDGFAATIMSGVLTVSATPKVDVAHFQPVQQTVFASGPDAA